MQLRFMLVCALAACASGPFVGCGGKGETKTPAPPTFTAPPLGDPQYLSATKRAAPQGQAHGMPESHPDKEIKTPSGLKYEELAEGSGNGAQTGDVVVVDYTGWLANGTKFESSLDSGKPYKFQLGRREVIAGWDEGIKGMKVGGRRKLIIPSKLGYGGSGNPPRIPPDAELVFEVELLKIY
jgi:FKBP-type peptidyl-prolyl cis-trans isomerase